MIPDSQVPEEVWEPGTRVQRFLDRSTRPSWFTRRATFWLPGGDTPLSTACKFGAPLGVQVIVVYEMTDGDGRAWLSPDGNWNTAPVPIHPATTFEEAVAYLSRCGVSPRLRYTVVDGKLVSVSMEIWPASTSDALKAWREGEAP